MESYAVLVEDIIREARKFAKTKESLQDPDWCKIRLYLTPDVDNKEALKWLHGMDVFNASIVSDDVPVEGIVELRSYTTHMYVRERDAANKGASYLSGKPFCVVCICVSGGSLEDNKDCVYSTAAALKRFFDEKQFVLNIPK